MSGRNLCGAILLAALAMSAAADSLFSAKAAEEGTLVSDKKNKFEVGDIIVVTVREKIDAVTASDTDTKKESDIGAQAPVASNPFLVADSRGPGAGGLNIINPEELPNWNIEIENEHKTAGATRRKNTLITTIACTVTEVHKNGTVTIEGEKRVTVNREDSLIKVKGVVRARDVTAANTVDSNLIANAEVELKGKGPLWNNQRRGILTRLLDWFSPF